MNEKKYIIGKLTENQSRIYIDTDQVYHAYMDAKKDTQKYSGSMIWKQSKGNDYLFRLTDRYGNGKSLGRRSSGTEKIFKTFHREKKATSESLNLLLGRLKEQAKFCKAIGINRVPSVVTGILRILIAEKLMGNCLTIVGSNALYAYEASTGVRFDTSITTTVDMDMLWDTRGKMTFYAENTINKNGLIGLLKKADASFKLIRDKGFRAVNDNGYMIDLIKPMENPPWKKNKKSFKPDNDFEAVDIRNLDWLISSPKFEGTVIGMDGFPATMIVPDPRAFALHKLWLSKQTDREPLKKSRDYAQAIAVIHLIINHLPQYPFKKSELKMFPKEIVDSAFDEIEKQKSPIGLD